MAPSRGRPSSTLAWCLASALFAVCVDRQYIRARAAIRQAAASASASELPASAEPIPPPPPPADQVRLPKDACPHIRREDLLFLEPFLSDLDWSPEAWPLTKWRLLNFEDTGHCGSDDPPPAAGQRPTGRKSRKVFGLGLSKTATTSLSEALRLLRYRNVDMAADFWGVIDSDVAAQFDAARPRGLLPRDRQRVARAPGGPTSPRCRRSAVTGLVREFFAQRDSATDLPTALFYDELRAAYPSARFVLTTRDVPSWWSSARVQMKRNPKSDTLARNRFGAYGVSRAHVHMFAKRFVEHYKHVLRSVPCCQLLVMNILAGDGWERLCPFLNEPRVDAPFPNYLPNTRWLAASAARKKMEQGQQARKERRKHGSNATRARRAQPAPAPRDMAFLGDRDWTVPRPTVKPPDVDAKSAAPAQLDTETAAAVLAAVRAAKAKAKAAKAGDA